jgi:CheY-like chemotaxis protein
MDGFVDNPVAQRLLIKQLQRHDLNVIATSNGEEAIAGKSFV